MRKERSKTDKIHRVAAKDCDVIMTEIQDRFNFIVSVAKLISSIFFYLQCQCFTLTFNNRNNLEEGFDIGHTVV